MNNSKKVISNKEKAAQASKEFHELNEKYTKQLNTFKRMLDTHKNTK